MLELYEPLWDEIYARASNHGFSIRGIWIADATNLGWSGVLNEDKLSNDASWMDHPRDLLLLINQFREQMPRPLVGIGHSFGGNIITNLAYLHPRLFSTVLLLDPVIQLTPPSMGFGTEPTSAINFTVHRSDVWPNRKAAAAAQRRLMQGWDKRCLDLMVQHGFRKLPTALHPDLPDCSSSNNPDNSSVTLTTTKHQDVLTQIRENFAARLPDGRLRIDRSTHADLDPLAAFVPLYRPEPRSTFLKLPTLRLSALFLLGSTTFLKLDEMRIGISSCGEGVGGSGGSREGGKVKEVLVDGHGHLFPFEAVGITADHCATWLGRELKAFAAAEAVWSAARSSMKKRDHLTLGKEWFDVVKPPPGMKKSERSKSKL